MSSKPVTSASEAIEPHPDEAVRAEDFAVLPRHIAIIMDGNGRWARQRDQARIIGHQRGALVARSVVLEAARLGVEALTLYSFSTENWKRPAEEVDFLMELGVQHLRSEEQRLHEHNIRFVHVGSREGLPPHVLENLDRIAELTAGNTGMTLAMAINYGARGELTEAVRRLAERVAAGELEPGAIDEQMISDELDTATMPDPDLLIRTAGEMRLSNFLLWQISYAELWVTPTLWPDFTTGDLHQAMHDFAQRQRRFGGVVQS